jgi:hypothetical protein
MKNPAAILVHIIHKYFIFAIVFSYFAAALLPQFGLSSWTLSFSGSSSRPSCARLRTRLMACPWASSWMPSSFRKSSKDDPRCLKQTAKPEPTPRPALCR